MLIAFAEKNLRDICENESKATSILGRKNAEKLMHRLADLRAANQVFDLIIGNPHEISGPCPRDFSIDICTNISIILCSNHSLNPLLQDGCIDWSKVSRIKILRIRNENS